MVKSRIMRKERPAYVGSYEFTLCDHAQTYACYYPVSSAPSFTPDFKAHGQVVCSLPKPRLLYRQWMSFVLDLGLEIYPVDAPFRIEHIASLIVHADLRTRAPPLEMKWDLFIWILLALGVSPHDLYHMEDVNHFTARTTDIAGELRMYKVVGGWAANVEHRPCHFSIRNAIVAAGLIVLEDGGKLILRSLKDPLEEWNSSPG